MISIAPNYQSQILFYHSDIIYQLHTIQQLKRQKAMQQEITLKSLVNKDNFSANSSFDSNNSEKVESQSPLIDNQTSQLKEACSSPTDISTSYISCVIEPISELGGVYISDYDYASNLQNLEKDNIKSVLSIDRNHNFKLPDSYNHKTIIVFDNEMESIKVHFDKSYQFIFNSIQNKQNILIHCRRGISRSATILIAFLMKFQNKSYEDCYNFLKQKRPVINPNSGFVKQLKSYEKVLKEFLLFTNQLK
ncbi:hypothetical protein ABPG72_003362 [Tetrahymena utriculariae]